MPEVLIAKFKPGLTFEKVENEIRRRNYGVLSTISNDKRPHSVGVIYAVSAKTRPFALYIVTDKRSKKARNIAQNPNVSFVIQVPGHLKLLPPSSIQFQGTAKIVPLTDEASREAFNASLVTRKVLNVQLNQKKDVSTFIRVRPDPVIFTYGIAVSVLQLIKHIENAAGKVRFLANA